HSIPESFSLQFRLLSGNCSLEFLGGSVVEFHSDVLGSRSRGWQTVSARESRQELVHAISQKLGVRKDVDKVVAFIFCRQHWIAQLGGGMAEACVDDPSLMIVRCPDRVAVPVERILGLPVPLEMPDVSGLPVHTMTVKRTHDCNARI